MSSPVEIAHQLRREADALLFDGGIDALLRQHGDVFYAGSYTLDLMAWPDIDLNLIVPEENDPISAAEELASSFIKRDKTASVRFERNLHKRFPDLPKGLYLGVKLDIGQRSRPWKLDIWIVNDQESNKTKKKTAEIRRMLTPLKREVILSWKQKLMTPKGRTPSFSGYWLYQAILHKGLESEKEILDFLREKGIDV